MTDGRNDRDTAGVSGTARDCEGAFAALHDALLDVVNGKTRLAEIREPVRQLCALARREEMSAEQILIRFKEIWASLPPHAGLPRGRQRNDLMAQVATMCIEEFYGPSAAKDRQSGLLPHLP